MRTKEHHTPILPHLAVSRPTHNGCTYRRVMVRSLNKYTPDSQRLAWEIECPGVPKKIVYTMDAVDVFTRSLSC